ncbi:MAG: glycosyltransferase family 39 protein [Chloroflexota bacterium]
MNPSEVVKSPNQAQGAPHATLGLLSPFRSLWLAIVGYEQWPAVLVLPLLVATIVLRLLWVNLPQGSLIFDESYYVNAARIMLGWPVPEGSAYAGSQPGVDPNFGHMPLAKVMMVQSMRFLGDNGLGWRLPSVLTGTLSVGLLYLLVRRITGRPWLALFAAFIFSFDNLVFVHGRIATLDMPMVAFALLGVYAYMARSPAIAGGALALSALAKFNGVFVLVAIVGFEVLRFLLIAESRSKWRSTLGNLLLLCGVCTVVFLMVLWPLDYLYTNYQSPLDHLAADVFAGLSLRNPGPPQGIASMPWQWLMNEGAIPYLTVKVDMIANGAVVGTASNVKFLGQMNLFVITMLPLALGYLLHAAFAKRSELAMLALCLMGVTYGQPFILAVFFHRISYIHYFLPVLPALCIGIAYFLLDSRLPRLVPVVYSIAVLAGFVALFPFRTIP